MCSKQEFVQKILGDLHKLELLVLNTPMQKNVKAKCLLQISLICPCEINEERWPNFSNEFMWYIVLLSIL